VSADLSKASQLSEQARAEYEGGRLDAAAAMYSEAMHSYQLAGDDLMAAEMANNLAVVLIQDDRPEIALEIVQPTAKIFLEHGDHRRAGLAEGNLASALAASGERTAAGEHYQAALELLSDAGDSEAYTYTLQALSRLQLEDGHPIEALHTMQTGIELKPRKSLRDRLLSRILNIPPKLT
jgi:tetratricopeptide (TPR) repeat protein